jgi:hypothetical protein
VLGHNGPQYAPEYVLFAVVFGIPVLVAVGAFVKPIGWVARRRHRTIARTIFSMLVGFAALVVMWVLLVLYVLAELNSSG